MDIIVADHPRRRELLTAFDGYCYDLETVDGVTRVPFGVEDRATGAELVRGHHRNVEADGYARGPFPVTLTHRAADLPLDRAVELIRAAYFHWFANHSACDWVGSLVITDIDGTEHTYPFDAC